ncbi:hypothetical protein [Nostoc sp.]|uniref:hypothetical protein n=1 Tax=Nostoc sp. TaxID=1180 RepID=UPI002FF89C9A
MLDADQKTFAGILPGVLFSKRLIRKTVEAQVTVAAVIKAEKKVRELEDLNKGTPLIILGSKGFIGRRLTAELIGREIFEVDIVQNNKDTWPYHLYGKRAMLINLTRKAVLDNYLARFWSELILVNEVYPEPTGEELNKLTTQGNRAYHIVGINADAYPPFPKAYKGGIPCCAARLSDEMDVIIRKITP